MLDNIGVTIPLVVVLVLLLVVVIAQKQRRDPLRAIPGPKPYPIIGNVYEMIQMEAVELFLQWCAEYGKILKYKVFLLGELHYLTLLLDGYVLEAIESY